jgi:hypothetical protein
MEKKRTAHAYLVREGVRPARSRPLSSQARERGTRPICFTLNWVHQGAAKLNEGLAQPNCRIVRLPLDVGAEPEITAPSRTNHWRSCAD